MAWDESRPLIIHKKIIKYLVLLERINKKFCFHHFVSNRSTAPLLGMGSTHVDLHGIISLLLTVVTISSTLTGNMKNAQPSFSSHILVNSV